MNKSFFDTNANHRTNPEITPAVQFRVMYRSITKDEFILFSISLNSAGRQWRFLVWRWWVHARTKGFLRSKCFFTLPSSTPFSLSPPTSVSVLCSSFPLLADDFLLSLSFRPLSTYPFYYHLTSASFYLYPFLSFPFAFSLLFPFCSSSLFILPSLLSFPLLLSPNPPPLGLHCCPLKTVLSCSFVVLCPLCTHGVCLVIAMYP